MIIENGGMKTDFFLGGIRIQLTTYIFQTIYDMVRTAFFSAFERHMFPKVRQALLIRQFIPATNIQHDAAMRYLRVRDLLVRDPDPIGKRMCLIFFC